LTVYVKAGFLEKGKKEFEEDNPAKKQKIGKVIQPFLHYFCSSLSQGCSS
jgi:hypothetical protein